MNIPDNIMFLCQSKNANGIEVLRIAPLYWMMLNPSSIHLNEKPFKDDFCIALHFPYKDVDWKAIQTKSYENGEMLR